MNNTYKALVVTGVLFASSVNAEIAFNGFASIVGGVTTSSDETLYGYDDAFDFSQGSLLALQASSDLSEGLGVTVQILAKGEDDWAPSFEWAYVSYDATDNLRLLAGRQRAPFYMYSDFLDVSYAYTWIAPPKGVYDLLIDTFDGIGAIYGGNIGEFDTTLQVLYGRNSDEKSVFGEDVNIDFKSMIGGSYTINRDWLTLRAGYFQADINIPHSDINTLAAGWQQVGFTGIANEVYIAEDDAIFIEAGFQIDYENFIMVGEYTSLTLDNTPLADQESYYIMGGWRVDNLLFHLTYGADEDTKSDITANVSWGLHSDIDYLKAATQGLVNNQLVEQSYITLGLRWDFHDSAALKFEYTDYTDDLNGMNDSGLFRTALVTVF
ncbi:MAG: porin [Colwellia sp.]